MRALELPGVGEPLRLVTRPVPDPGPGEVRVRVEACGVCGSDLFLQSGGFGADKLPRIPGHEAAGRVDAIGTGVGSVMIGEQVALYYIDAPADGKWARQDRENLEPGLTRMGVDVDGAFAEYITRPAHTLIPVAEPIEPAVLAVLTDAVATPYHALVRCAEVGADETVLVLGIGGIGSNAVQLARHFGARVVAASRSAEKLALAENLGADSVIVSGGDEDAERLREACGGGADVVVQCVGSPAVDRLAVEVAAPGGRVVLVGASNAPFSVSSTELIWRELSLLGSRGFTRRDIAEVLDLHRGGTLRTDHLTRSLRPLEDGNEALEELRAGTVLRAVLLP